MDCSGSMEVICGSMFSGKTEELIRRLKEAQANGLFTEIFHPKIDTRYSENSLVSHNANRIPSKPVAASADILAAGKKVQVVGIDEAQFFDDGLPAVCNLLVKNGVRVIIAGLDMDFKGRPFGPMPTLMAIAESVTKVHAVCLICGNPALYSYRLVPSKEKVLLGEKDSYEPRCRICYNLKTS